MYRSLAALAGLIALAATLGAGPVPIVAASLREEPSQEWASADAAELPGEVRDALTEVAELRGRGQQDAAREKLARLVESEVYEALLERESAVALSGLAELDAMAGALGSLRAGQVEGLAAWRMRIFRALDGSNDRVRRGRLPREPTSR